MQWNANELAWAKKHGVNLGQKTSGGLSTNADYQRITGGGGSPKPPAGGGGGSGGGGGGGGLQWNSSELAWAKQHGVTLGQKTAGGLSTNADYQRITGGGAPAGGGGGVGGGLISGRPGGPQQAFGAGAPNMPKYGAGTILGGAAAAGVGAGAASIAMGGLGSMSPLMAFGPAGIAAGAGLLALGMLGKKKSNRQFEGDIATGGAQGFKQSGGQLAQISEGYIPTVDEFTQHGRWLLPTDSYAHDYGRTFGAGDAQYYQNFQQQAQAALQAGNMDQYKGIMAQHGFEVPGAPKPAPSAGRRKKAEPAAAAAPAPSEPKREEVSKPAQGLESTIKTTPKETVERPGLKPGLNKYNVPFSRKRRAGFFSFARS